LQLSDIQKRAVLSVGEKKICVYMEQHPSASQQNIANYFSILWVNPWVSAVLEIFWVGVQFLAT
jgi:hypothetical protein